MKSNQVRNRLNFSPGHPPQSKIGLFVGMGVRLCPVILNIDCGLYITSPVWGRYLDQGSYTKMDEATEARKVSLCKYKGVKHDEQLIRQGIHHGRSDPRTDVLLLCAKRNRGYFYGV